MIFYLILAILLFYFYVKCAQSYWKRIGVDYIKPKFFIGNIALVEEYPGDVHFSQVYKNFYQHFKKKGEKFGGVYNKLTPILIPVDLDLIADIMHTQFSSFANTDTYTNEESDPLTYGLVNLKAEKWRNLRNKLTPTFTSGKMKMMFHTILECADVLKKKLNQRAELNEPINSKEVFARFAIDIVGSVAFGLDIKSLEDPDSEFRYYSRKIYAPPKNFFQTTKKICTDSLPIWLLDILKIKLTGKDLEAFFLKWVKDTVEYREKNNIYRKDFLHLLIQLKNMNEVSDGKELTKDSKKNVYLSTEQIAAQCYVFFIGGYDTSSSTITFALLNLALHNDIQDKARDEIQRVLAKYNNQVCYDAISEMNYLEQILSETLRKHCPATVIRRVCTADYKIPNSDCVIKKGTIIRIPIYGLHFDEEYFPEPDKFDPDRFSPKNKLNIPTFAYMPFGEGPRTCIGRRFGILQAKVALYTILKNYRIILNEKTKLPIKMDPLIRIPDVQGGLWLNLERI